MNGWWTFLRLIWSECGRPIVIGGASIAPCPSYRPKKLFSALAAARRVKHEPMRPRLELARLRNIAMLEALRSSGMRVGELVGLIRDDLDYRQHCARVTGKGDKQRVVYFDDAAWNAIQSYLKAHVDGARGRALYALPLFARHDRRVGARILPLHHRLGAASIRQAHERSRRSRSP